MLAGRKLRVEAQTQQIIPENTTLASTPLTSTHF